MVEYSSRPTRRSRKGDVRIFPFPMLGPYRTVVDCSMSMPDMVRDGHYHDEAAALAAITEARFPVNLPLGRSSRYELDLYVADFSSKPPLRWCDVLKCLEAASCTFRRVHELLALGAQHSHLQEDRWVVAPGSWSVLPEGNGVLYPVLACGVDRSYRSAGTFCAESPEQLVQGKGSILVTL